MRYSIKTPPYKWTILALAATTNAVVVAVPMMGLSVLLPEISGDLKLTLVEAGLVWSISALPSIVTGLFGGVIGDRLGPKRVLIASCLLTGLAGALRGLAGDFISLAAMMFLFGILLPVITINNFKVARIWFPSQELGFANGVLSMGMALGFLIGSMISATLISPWLGGWRNVFFFYGAISAALAIPWYFTRPSSDPAGLAAASPAASSITHGMSHVARLRNVWLLGLAGMGINGSVQSVLGYLPLYLRSLGWPDASADGALASFHTISMLCVLPITLWSDRLGSRKRISIVTALLIVTGIGLLSFVRDGAIWGAVLLAGLARDGFMAILMTMIIESRGVGLTYSGTATGFAMIFMGIGNLIAPPLGNGMAEISAGAPFLFWLALSGLGVVCIGLASGADQPSRQPAPAEVTVK